VLISAGGLAHSAVAEAVFVLRLALLLLGVAVVKLAVAVEETFLLDFLAVRVADIGGILVAVEIALVEGISAVLLGDTVVALAGSLTLSVSTALLETGFNVHLDSGEAILSEVQAILTAGTVCALAILGDAGVEAVAAVGVR